MSSGTTVRGNWFPGVEERAARGGQAERHNITHTVIRAGFLTVMRKVGYQEIGIGNPENTWFLGFPPSRLRNTHRHFQSNPIPLGVMSLVEDGVWMENVYVLDSFVNRRKAGLPILSGRPKRSSSEEFWIRKVNGSADEPMRLPSINEPHVDSPWGYFRDIGMRLEALAVASNVSLPERPYQFRVPSLDQSRYKPS